MTYPQQPYQQQQYGAPPPGYYGQPPAQPQQQVPYAQPYQQPAPQQYAPAAPVPQAAPTFVEPPTFSEAGSPLKIREIEGRVCVVRPTKYIEAKDGQGEKVVFDVLVVDGPTPLQYGESKGFEGNAAGPPVLQLDSLPAEIKGVMTGNWEIVRACKQVLEENPGSVFPCRVARGNQGNRPYIFAKLGGDLDPQAAVADQARGAAAAAHAAVTGGVWPDGTPYVPPVPREINGGPRKQAQQNRGQTAPQQAPQYPPAQYPPAQPQGQVVYPPAGPTHPVVAAYNAQAPAQQQYVPPPAMAAPSPAPTDQRQAMLDGHIAPDGWNPQTWASLQPAQRAQFLP